MLIVWLFVFDYCWLVLLNACGVCCVGVGCWLLGCFVFGLVYWFGACSFGWFLGFA